MSDRNASMQYKFKRLGAIALLVIFISISLPSHAFAGSVAGTGGSTEVTQIAKMMSDIAAWAQDFAIHAANIAVTKFRKQLLDTIVNQLIAWINDDKKPSFMSDFPKVLKETADTAGMLMLQDRLGTDFVAGLCQPDWAISIKATLSKPPTFGEKAKCSFDQVSNNYHDFMDHFTKGGWSNWISVSESNNNPYMVYMTALDEKLTRQAEKQSEKKEDNAAGGGFLSDKVCTAVTYYATQEEADKIDANGNPIGNKTVDGPLALSESEFRDLIIKDMQNQEPYHDRECVNWETRSPGKILADAANRSLFKDVDWLQNNKEWEAYVVAIGDALVNRLTKEGIKAIKSYDVKAGDVADTGMDVTPPVTSATIIDPWSIRLSPNESSKTGYTLDGSEPGFFSKTMTLYSGEPIPIVNSTDSGSTPISSIKWKSMDAGSNIEKTRMLSFQNSTSPLPISPFDLAELKIYLKGQDESIPQNIQTKIINLTTSQSDQLNKTANDTTIPTELITSLANYIAIEDLRIQLGKSTVINTADLTLLKDVVASSTERTIAQFITRTDLGSYTPVLADIHQKAQNIEQARIDLGTLLKNVTTYKISGFAGITITQLANTLALSPEFKDILNEINTIISDRSIIKLGTYIVKGADGKDIKKDGWDDTKIYTVAVAVDDHSLVLLSNKPSVIKYSIPLPNKSSSLMNSASFLDQGNYIQKITLPADDREYTINYQAEWTDASGITQTEALHTLKLKAPFPNAELPYLVNLVEPTADIKDADTLTPDASGFITLDPSSSVDFDRTPSIAGYEWSFASDKYDWRSFDLNRDGTFETTGCLFGDQTCNKTYPVKTKYGSGYSTATVPGFESISVVNPDSGVIKVKLSATTTPGTPEIRTIKLRVTDDEGLWTEKTATITLP